MKEKEILEILGQRFGIDSLNEMQRKMLDAASKEKNIILLSPTGSGKTLAFLLPLLKILKPGNGRIRCVVIAPSRELVIQIAGVFRETARDYRIIALYGGHSVEDEVNSLKMTPDIVIATPGRLLDHSKRHNLELLPVGTLVIDEFDKCLELGFEDEMKKLVGRMKNLDRIFLTSATDMDILPEFLNMENPVTLNFLPESRPLEGRMTIHRVNSANKDKLESLLSLLHFINAADTPEKSIVFVNHRESAERVYEFLRKKGVACVLYHGALDQRERETSVALFNNGSRPVMVATDLAARGLDIQKVKSVIHYHQPLTPEAFTHRNGRSARVEETGDAYVLVGPEETVQPFIDFQGEVNPDKATPVDLSSKYTTLYFSGGKKEKISKGDIVGFLTKEGNINVDDIGKINLFDHYALAAINSALVDDLLKNISGKKIKGQKLRISQYN